MTSGPSKQELEMYWQNSRQYFDELAVHYKNADPQYYKEYIEPFYTNPFANMSSGKRQSSGGSSKAALIVVLAMVMLIGTISAVLFIYLGSQDTGSKELEKVMKQLEDDKKTTQQETTKPEVKEKNKGDVKEEETVEPEDPLEMSSEDNFIIGSKYLGEKKYDKAEYHLKKIKPGQKYYKESQQLLQNMKFLRQYDK